MSQTQFRSRQVLFVEDFDWLNSYWFCSCNTTHFPDFAFLRGSESSSEMSNFRPFAKPLTVATLKLWSKQTNHQAVAEDWDEYIFSNTSTYEYDAMWAPTNRRTAAVQRVVRRQFSKLVLCIGNGECSNVVELFLKDSRAMADPLNSTDGWLLLRFIKEYVGRQSKTHVSNLRRQLTNMKSFTIPLEAKDYIQDIVSQIEGATDLHVTDDDKKTAFLDAMDAAYEALAGSARFNNEATFDVSFQIIQGQHEHKERQRHRAQEHLATAEALGLMAKSTGKEETAHYTETRRTRQPERRGGQLEQRSERGGGQQRARSPPLQPDIWATGTATHAEGNMPASATTA